jgi:LemA protein
MALSFILVIAATLFMWLWSIFNSFTTLRNEAFERFSQFKATQEKKLDMTEQLLGVVKDHMATDKEVLDQISAIRNKTAMGGPAEMGPADKESKALAGKLISIAMSDPAMRSSSMISNIEGSIKDLDSEIVGQKNAYNDMAGRYNTLLETSPSSIIGELMGMRKLGPIDEETS